jgi:hypothetical protein
MSPLVPTSAMTRLFAEGLHTYIWVFFSKSNFGGYRMKACLFFSGAVLIILLSLRPAMAVGFGVYGDVQRGFTNYGGILGGEMEGWMSDIGSSGGIVLDSAVAANTPFNYRLRLGGGLISENHQKFTHFNLIHTFGISPSNLRGDMVRYWFGPRIGIHHLRGSYAVSSVDYGTLYMVYNYFPGNSALLLAMFTPEKIKVDLFKGDIGLVLAGFNFNFGDTFTISLEFGVDYGFTIGSLKSGSYHGYGYGEGIEGFANIAIMFRINDTYSAAASNQ